MKFNRMVRPALAAATSLAISLGISACSRDYTAAYVYAVSASTGGVSAYGVDYQSGVLTQINGSPFPSGLTNPTTLVTHPSEKYLYVIGGTQNSEVVEEAIGTDGKLYAGSTYNITGTYPTSAAVDSAGLFLFVTYEYQKQYTPASPGPGGVTIFPISQASATFGQLGTPINVNLGNNPVAIAVSTPATGSTAVYAYVVDQEASPNATVLAFSVNTTSGALTPVSGTSCTTTAPTACTGIDVGVTPSAIGADPTGRFVYVTDKTSNEIYGFTIGTTSGSIPGALTAMSASPWSTGQYPVSVTIDPRGEYLYTANYNSNTISGYAISSATGFLGGTASVSAFTTKTGPTCVTIEPALGIYLYTSNYLDNSLSGGQLSPNTGQVTQVVDSPFPAGGFPSCVASVSNGSHASEIPHP